MSMLGTIGERAALPPRADMMPTVHWCRKPIAEGVSYQDETGRWRWRRGAMPIRAVMVTECGETGVPMFLDTVAGWLRYLETHRVYSLSQSSAPRPVCGECAQLGRDYEARMRALAEAK